MYHFQNFLLYNPILHRSLRSGELEPNKYVGIYLVVFRVLKTKNGNVVIYHYIYYPGIFTDSMLMYLITKNHFERSYLYSDWGDFITLIDRSLGNNLNISEWDLHEVRKKSKYFVDFTMTSEYEAKIDMNNLTGIFDIMKKTVNLFDTATIMELLDLILKKDYNKFILTMTTTDSTPENVEWVNKIISYSHKDIYLLEDCLFVVKDLDLVLKNLKEKKYTVTKGRRYSGTLNSMTTFLSSIDLGYRNDLYKYHHFLISCEIMSHKDRLNRSKFSFTNIHRRIGNIPL